MQWRRIERLCEKFNCDAILSLEFFDSDFLVTNTEKVKDVKDKNGKITKTPYFYAEGIGKVKLGFRVYDSKNKNISDQYMTEHSKKWSAEGKTKQLALAALLSRKDGINYISKDLGMAYAERISPHWITVYRHFYRKPKKDMQFSSGVRKSQVNDWEGALNDWLISLKSTKKKVAKRSMFNAALAYEVLGDLEKAKKMASEAYTIYKLKKARNYVGTLDYRIREEERLRQQME